MTMYDFWNILFITLAFFGGFFLTFMAVAFWFAWYIKKGIPDE